MSKIRILPDHVANQIAAGEVVERPASVLKELIENALDAGAGCLDIRWEEGGKRLLEIADDGCGMGRDDLYLALERHATSKVRTADDLTHLESYGFRGEALPSIASVTRFDLHSAEEEGMGHRLRCEYGVIKEVTPSPRAKGTTVTIQDLFAQLPARKRFLKSTDTEHAQLWGVVTRMALATPAVRWTIRVDRGSELVLPPVASASERLGPLLGDKFRHLVTFKDGELPWLLHGFISKPELSFRDRNHLYLFVNGRAVRDRLLLAAISDAWQGFFPKGAYPAALIYLYVPPEAVDVNVHPTKAEVRFREPQRIFPWLSRALREAWENLKSDLPRVLDLPPKPLELEFDAPLKNRAPKSRELWAQDEPQTPAPRSQDVVTRALDFSYSDAPEDDQAAESPEEGNISAPPAPEVRYLGAFDATYLVAESQGEQGPELWIIDQHVAHERVLFEKHYLRKHFSATQPLLPPKVLHLGPAQLARLSPWLTELQQVGLDCEAFGDDALVVRGLPDFLSHQDPESLVDALLERLEAKGKADLESFRLDLNAELSCRAAIKKHHVLSPELASRLIQDLMACDVPHTCPHGRPVIKKLTKGELERSFGRRV